MQKEKSRLWNHTNKVKRMTRIGPNSAGITLPNYWLRALGIKRTDELLITLDMENEIIKVRKIIEKDNLIIKPKKGTNEEVSLPITVSD